MEIRIHGTEIVPSGMWGQDPAGSPLPMPSVAGLAIEYDGEAIVHGSDHLLRLQATYEGVQQRKLVFGELQLGSKLWRRTYVHSWLEAPGSPPPAPGILALLHTLDALEEDGTTTEDGQTLHRLRVPAPVPLGLPAVALADEDVKELDMGTIEVLALSDGTPARAVVRFTSDDFDYAGVLPSGIAQPRSYVFEYEFASASALTLPDPVEPVATFASEKTGITFDRPPSFRLKESEDPWEELWSGRRVITLVRSQSSDFTGAPSDPAELLDAFTVWVIGDTRERTGWTDVSTESIAVAGLPGYLVAFRPGPSDQDQALRLAAMFVSGTSLYEIDWEELDWEGAPGDELRHRFEFERLLSSVELSP